MNADPLLSTGPCREAEANLRGRAVVVSCQTLEKVLSDLRVEVHAIESASPAVEDVRAGRSVERELLVAEREGLGHVESRSLQVVLELPSHVEIVSVRRERLARVGVELHSRPRGEGLVSEEIVDLGES